MTTITSAVYRAAKQHSEVAGDVYFEKKIKTIIFAVLRMD